MRIFIDAGHNNARFNTGAVGNGLKEQDITFEVSKELGLILTAGGLETKLSRPVKETNLGTDNASAINARWKMANEWKADYFISVHCNAFADAAANGVETLYFKPESLVYAETIQNSYLAKAGLKSRGVKYRNDVAVIKYALMPAILIELAFISNPADAAFLKSSTRLMAQGIADGIFQMCGIKTEEQPEEKRYNTISEFPAWARPTIQKLVDKGYLAGDEKGNLNLSEDMARVFVIHDRAKVYDK